MKKTAAVIAIISMFVVCAVLVSPLIAQKTEPVTVVDGLTLLKEGNARFVGMKPEHPGQRAERREVTARYGQKPYAIVLACADSRVPVEVIFDAGIGDIFVVRNAGNVGKDDVVAGSIEYAAKHLNVPLLVILGHTECGAVSAGLSDVPAAGNIRVIQQIIEPAAAEVKESSPALQGPELMIAVTKANVLKSKADLLARSEIIKSMYEDGSLRILTAVYDIETGVVDWGEY